ncbi:MAG: BON domain-containing protein [Thermoanaerobaculia bacterium]
MFRNRKFVFLTLFLVALAATACSMNRQLPAEMDAAAMEGDVRAAIAAAVPGKTFDLGVDVTEGGNVTLTGEVDSAADHDAIVSRVRQVNGVRSVNHSGLRVK